MASSVSSSSLRAAGQLAKCTDTSGLAACAFPTETELEENPGALPDPACLGSTPLEVAGELVDLLFGLDD